MNTKDVTDSPPVSSKVKSDLEDADHLLFNI